MTLSQCGPQAKELKHKVMAGVGRAQDTAPFHWRGEEKGERLNDTTAFCPPEAVKLSLLDNSKLCVILRFYDFAEQRGTKRKKNKQVSSIVCSFKAQHVNI